MPRDRKSSRAGLPPPTPLTRVSVAATLLVIPATLLSICLGLLTLCGLLSDSARGGWAVVNGLLLISASFFSVVGLSCGATDMIKSRDRQGLAAFCAMLCGISLLLLTLIGLCLAFFTKQ